MIVAQIVEAERLVAQWKADPAECNYETAQAVN